MSFRGFSPSIAKKENTLIAHIKIKSAIHSRYLASAYLALLKGSVSRYFRPPCFHKSIPPRPLTDGLTPFRIWLRIRRDIRFESRQNQSPRCQWKIGEYIRSISDTAEMISAVVWTPRKFIVYWMPLGIRGHIRKGFNPFARTQVRLIDEKTRGSKISWHFSLN
jgi:hypothetical protein